MKYFPALILLISASAFAQEKPDDTIDRANNLLLSAQTEISACFARSIQERAALTAQIRKLEAELVNLKKKPE